MAHRIAFFFDLVGSYSTLVLTSRLRHCTGGRLRSNFA